MISKGQTAEVDNIYDVYEDEEDSMENRFLTFNISNESYGINIKHVIEIIELQKITISNS